MSSFECNLNFELIGTLLAIAIYNSVHLDLRFPKLVYKKLLGEPVKLEDIEEFEPQLYTTIRNISNMSPDEVGSLGLDFCISYDYFGAEMTHELKENGSKIELSAENRDEYVDLYLDWIANKSVEKQFTPFYNGFYKVISKESIRVYQFLWLTNQ